MANLDDTGVGILWERIRGFVRQHILGNVLGQPGRIVITDSSGGLSTSDSLRANVSRATIYDLPATDPSEYFDLGVDGMYLYILIPDDDPGATLSPMESINIELDGAGETLIRRHYEGSVAEDSCIVFGNTKYTGYGTPACQGQADTGEPYMVFYMDGMLGVCLPDNDAHSLWIGTGSSCIAMDGTPSDDADLINLAYYRDHMPVGEGDGAGSLRQNIAGSSANGIGSFAANVGNASGRYAFAANSGIASSEYAAATGVHTTASGRGAFVSGYETTASGTGAFAAGDSCRASGKDSHAEGKNTIATGEEQFVFGRYNAEDSAGTYVEIVGIGEGGVRKNGRTLDWSGNEYLAGTLNAGGLILRDSSGRKYNITIVNGSISVTAVS